VTRQWRVKGQPIDPGRIAAPTLVVAPQTDQLVPSKAATALAKTMPNATLLEPPLGHIGMIVGRQARAAVWDKVAGFLSGG